MRVCRSWDSLAQSYFVHRKMDLNNTDNKNKLKKTCGSRTLDLGQ